MKKYTLQEIKEKFPDYIEILKRIKFKRIDSSTAFIYVEKEDKHINSDVEEVLWSKFVPKEGISVCKFDLKCEQYLNRLPDFLNFLIKQL